MPLSIVLYVSGMGMLAYQNLKTDGPYEVKFYK